MTHDIHMRAAVREKLKRKGYVRLDESFFGGQDPNLKIARWSFADSCRDLPRDDYCTIGNRHRRIGKFVLLPWDEQLISVPAVWNSDRRQYVTHYYQSPELNTEHGGKMRAFGSLTEEQRTNHFLHFSIVAGFRMLEWPHMEFPVNINVHIIQLTANANAPGVSTPDLIHRDGEPYTMAALISRIGVVGGENLITVPDVANVHPRLVGNNAVVERFTLEQPWEGWIVDDRRVAHYVSPVSVAHEHDWGKRTVLLIDYSRMLPEIQH